MKSVPLTAYARTSKGRAGVKKLRSQGRLPAIIYGEDRQAANLEVKARDVAQILHHSVSENILVDLSIEGDAAKRLVLVQEVQHNHLTGDILHVDFHEVSRDKKVSSTIPIETRGEAVGVKTGGGTLEQVLFKVRVSALPLDLPEFVLLDVSHLEVGASIHLADLPPMEGVEFHGDGHLTVVSVAAARTDPDAVAPAEPVEEDKKGKKPAAAAGGAAK